MIKLFLLLHIIFSSAAPSPELLAEPVPLLRPSTINPYVGPHWDKGPGHRGIDISLAENFELKAPFSGEVHFVGKVVDRKVITLISDSGLKASFEPVCSDLARGQRVIKHQPIATRCAADANYEVHCASCIHFSIRNEYGYLNPLLFYGELKAPTLLG